MTGVKFDCDVKERVTQLGSRSRICRTAALTRVGVRATTCAPARLIGMTDTRTETDSIGPIEVPADAYWGAQTERSLENFPFGARERMPVEIVRALAYVKLAAARVNKRHGLAADKAEAIEAAAREVIDGALDEQFPLVIWQTGSGTQSNMNVNEVIAGRANEAMAGTRGGKTPVHPNDDVNRGQSSNDSFPTALHVAASIRARHADSCAA